MRSRFTRVMTPALALSLVSCDPTSPDPQAVVDFFLGFCPTDAPQWLAYKNTGGNWTAFSLDANSNATIKVTSKFALAFVTDYGTDVQTLVFYATTNELSPLASGACEDANFGSRSANGSVSGLLSGEFADVSMAGSSAFVFAGGTTTFSLLGLPDAGAMDLVAIRSNSSGVPSSIIVRRDQNPTSGATMSPLNFGAGEAIAPAVGTLSFSGNGSDDLFFFSSFTTGNGTNAFFFPGQPGASSTTIYGVPASLTLATDIHMVDVSAYPLSGDYARSVVMFNRDVGNRTATLGALPNTPSFTVEATSPLRVRTNLIGQSDYNGLVAVEFDQSPPGYDRYYTIAMTSGYAGANPAEWVLEMPDLDAAGIPTAASLTGTSVPTEWYVTMTSAAPQTAFSSTAPDGSSFKFAYLSSPQGAAGPGGFGPGSLRRPSALETAARINPFRPRRGGR